MKKLLITGAFKYSEKQLSVLKHLDYEIIFIQEERKPLQIDVSDVYAVVCNGLFLYNDITRFKNLKLIQLTSAGMDRVPLQYINEHEIKIFNASGVYSIPMAEWVILKILEVYKKSKVFYKSQEQQNWEKRRDLLELTDKTAAILGFGSVGTEIAKRLRPFGTKIISVDKTRIKHEYVDEAFLIGEIDEVLPKSDIIALTLPLTEQTYHLIDEEKISWMKSSSVLVNVCRGGVIDEIALLRALKDNKFLGVALDVFEEEPLEDSSLWGFENVIVTPHNSFMSDKVNDRLFSLIVESLSLKE